MTRNHFEIGLPHVGTHEFDLLAQRLADHRKELREALLSTFLSDPEQSRAAGLDLVDEREVLVPSAILDLVNAESANRPELTMIQPPVDYPFHGIEDLLPAGAETQRGFFPRQLTSDSAPE